MPTTIVPAAAYLLLQAALTCAWWGLLWLVPSSRAWFRPAGYPDGALLSFWLADLTCVGAGSLLSAGLIVRRHPAASGCVWFSAGAIVYGALYCVAVTVQTGEVLLPAVMMAMAAGLTVRIAFRVPRA